MELNGVANIKMIIDMAKEDGKISPEIYDDIKEQLVLLKRYMIEFNKADGKSRKPFWHEVRDEIVSGQEEAR